MTVLHDQWQSFDRRARVGLVLGAALIVLATIGLGSWALRTEYQVLFADLAPEDAAGMVAELDRAKVPYRLSGAGNTILVPAELVYKTRLKLVGKELPLRGAVGFELFNNSEVGMTEFAQKVNYQRALQGELTRTILALDEVHSVRVHLVLPEQALFKKSASQAKASITLALKPGKALDASQVQGIQRLVGAAVPDIKPADVTIVDQRGVALTRRTGGEDDEGAGTDGLDDKRALEVYLNKKVVAVLDRMFGAGQGIASVDVTLNHEHSKVTTERVLGAQGEDGRSHSGTLVRERHNARDAGADSGHGPTATGASLISREADYQVGRRVEQVVARAGAVRHLNVAVVVRSALGQAQLDRLKEVVAVAVGIDKARGDAVAVYSVAQISNGAVADPAAALPALADAPAAATPAAGPAAGRAVTLLEVILGGTIGAALLALAWRATARRGAPRALNGAERDQVLSQVQAWLDTSPPPAKEEI